MKKRLISILRWSERYTKTDMVYFASGAFWGNLNAAVVTGFAFLASIFFARYLSKETYGMYQYVLSISSLIGAATLTGMSSAVARASARGHEGEFKHSVRYQIIAGIVPAILGLSVALWYFLHENNTLTLAFIIIAIFLPLANAYNTWAAYLGGKKIFRIGSYYSMANTVIAYGSILVAVFFSRSFIWVVFANFFFTFIGNFVIYHITLRTIPPNNERDQETMSYGTHLSVMGILGVFAGQLDSLLVFHFVGAAALAVYSFATLIPERLAGLLKFIPNLVIPKLAHKEESYVRKFLANRIWLFALVLLGIAILYAAFAPFIFHTFFPKYSDSILFSQVYSLSFFSLIASFIQTSLISQRKTKELYIINVINPLFRATLMIILMFFYGIWGLLWAQIASNFVSIIFQIVLFWKKSSPQTI